MYSHETAIKQLIEHDNVGKCGHAKCAGGDGTHCYEVGKGMRTYEEIKAEGIAEGKKMAMDIIEKELTENYTGLIRK